MRCHSLQRPASRTNRLLLFSTSPVRRCLREQSGPAAASMPERVREEHARCLVRNFASPSRTHVCKHGARIAPGSRARPAQPSDTPPATRPRRHAPRTPRPDLRACWGVARAPSTAPVVPRMFSAPESRRSGRSGCRAATVSAQCGLDSPHRPCRRSAA
jgi:hypothetical protein